MFVLFILAMVLLMVSVSAEEVNAGSLIRCPDYASVYDLDAELRCWVFPDEENLYDITFFEEVM
jgi:hypothetical protein